jgi:gas vesicle protein
MKTHRQEYQHKNLGEGTSRTKPVLGGLLLGGLIGAGTALLFAPHSGERTRAEIQNKTIELRDRTTDTVKDAVSQVKSKTRQMTSGVLGKNHEISGHESEAFDDQYATDVSQTLSSRRKTVQGP